MRFIGRLESDASPTSLLLNGWPASTPAISRMAVPELPQSSGSSGGCSLPAPAVDDEPRGRVGLDRDAHGLQRPHRADAVLAGQEAVDHGRAVGQRGEKHRAVREAFVPRDADFASDVAGLADGEGRGRGAAHGRRERSFSKIENAHFAQL